MHIPGDCCRFQTSIIFFVEIDACVASRKGTSLFRRAATERRSGRRGGADEIFRTRFVQETPSRRTRGVAMKRFPLRMVLLLTVIIALVLKANTRDTRTIECQIERIGGDPTNGRYGAWPACVNLITEYKPNIWSFGVGCDTTFELDLKDRFRDAQIISFDPTIDRERFESCMEKSSRAFGKITDSTIDISVFAQVGLANHSGLVSFKKSNDPRIGSKSIAHGIRDTSGKEYKADGDAMNFARVDTLMELYDRHGISRGNDDGYALDVLKIDIEGAEFDVIPSWCKTGFHPRVRQILIEFHDRLFIEGAHKRKIVYSCLRDIGYELVYENVPSKEEVVFIHFSKLL